MEYRKNNNMHLSTRTNLTNNKKEKQQKQNIQKQEQHMVGSKVDVEDKKRDGNNSRVTRPQKKRRKIQIKYNESGSEKGKHYKYK
mmetsp:Transcript_42291/g.47862  ORF Transcript_42291/g.47862 Transcript_42291/m.47862 type:complete len:85 (-) Transcript_42291:149-403(-)